MRRARRRWKPPSQSRRCRGSERMTTSTAERLEWQAPTTAPVPQVEPEPQDLAACLAGPNGQELVVEMAHDLRSPLTAILFLAESLQNAENGPVTDSQRRQEQDRGERGAQVVRHLDHELLPIRPREARRQVLRLGLDLWNRSGRRRLP